MRERTANQAWVFNRLRRVREPLTISEIAYGMPLSPATVRGVVGQLIKRGDVRAVGIAGSAARTFTTTPEGNDHE